VSAALDETPLPQWHIGIECRIETAHRQAILGEDTCHALHIVDPFVNRILLAKLVSAWRFRGQGGAVYANFGILARRELHARSLRDGNREDEAIVVIGVLADQIHRPGASAVTIAGRPKRRRKSLMKSGYQLME